MITVGAICTWLVEVTVVSYKYGYAGTLDLIADLSTGDGGTTEQQCTRGAPCQQHPRGDARCDPRLQQGDVRVLTRSSSEHGRVLGRG